MPKHTLYIVSFNGLEADVNDTGATRRKLVAGFR
ncbi:hypothetical protein ES707_00391 [subsurface metagenome]|jgi:hypothetical protein